MNAPVAFDVQLSTDLHGRWLAEVVGLPGAIACAATRDEALKKAKAVSFRILAYRIEHALPIPELCSALFVEDAKSGEAENSLPAYNA